MRPIIWEEGSDSASLDNALELLEESGREVLHAMMMLVPPAWENMAEMEPRLRDFYGTTTPSWSRGTAGLAFTDGMTVGAVLGRNGLRPSRYKIDQDGLVVAASEVGVVDMDDATIVEKGARPGGMLAVDTVRHRILHNDDLKREISERRPYGGWLARGLVSLGSLPSAAPSGSNGQASPNGQTPHIHQRPRLEQPGSPPRTGSLMESEGLYLPLLRRGRRQADADLTPIQLAFGYTAEEVKFIIRPMGAEGKRPRLLDGRRHPDGGPLPGPAPALHLLPSSGSPRSPTRRSIRSAKLVMSLRTLIGPRRSMLEETPEHARLLELETPVLLSEDWRSSRPPTPTHWWPGRWTPRSPRRRGLWPGLERGVDALCKGAAEAVQQAPPS